MSRILAVLACALACVAGAAYSQSGAVAGVVTHRATGQPFADVLVAVTAPGYYGRYPTDARGAFRLDGIKAGMWTIEFHCASANGVGREIQTKAVTVRAYELPTTVNVEVPEGYCDEPPYSERVAEFRGYVSFGFELSAFTPCDADWLNLSRNTFFDEPRIWVRFRAKPTELSADTLYFVDLAGTLRGPGSYGHLGISEYELEVAEILSANEVAVKDCAQHARRAPDSRMQPTREQ